MNKFNDELLTQPTLDQVISIAFGQNLKPVRKVVLRSNTHKVSGKHPSWKMGDTVHYESKNERNAFKLLDAHPEVISYYAQPCIIKYQLGGNTYKHIPDILVIFKDRKEFWEVKEAKDANNPEVKSRSELMEKCLGTFGYTYRVAIGENLEINHRLMNVEELLKHGFHDVSLLKRELVRQLFLKYGAINWGAFSNKKSDPIQLKHICRLILEGVLRCDMSSPIGPNTKILMNENMGVRS